jgi:polysaccharide deacetylase 2 family uncharacterized protein YibQ
MAPALLSAAETVLASAATRPRIVVIIDDLGNERAAGLRVTELPGPVACAILPHTPYADVIARHAHGAGKEVMLHLPLQPIEDEWGVSGIGTIAIDSTRTQMLRILEADLASIPHLDGVNTHMGSLLTQHPGHMRWLMAELKSRGNLFFVDSYTTASSVALQMAAEENLPAVRRHVFLDNVPRRAQIDAEFQRLKERATAQGYAVAIGHPYKATLNYLEAALPRLAREGFDLVSVSAVLGRNAGEESL